MNDSVHFFDPRPPVGLWHVVDRCGQESGQTEPVELLDATLPGSGRVTLRVHRSRLGEAFDASLGDVRETADGGLALMLETGGRLVFPAAQRDRVTAIILKLSTNYY